MKDLKLTKLNFESWDSLNKRAKILGYQIANGNMSIRAKQEISNPDFIMIDYYLISK